MTTNMKSNNFKFKSAEAYYEEIVRLHSVLKRIDCNCPTMANRPTVHEDWCSYKIARDGLTESKNFLFFDD